MHCEPDHDPVLDIQDQPSAGIRQPLGIGLLNEQQE